MTTLERPLLRYAGGKHRLAAWIVGHLPEHNVYCEPFCGAASVLLQKPMAPHEVIGDLDSHLANLFLVLRDNEEELLHRLERTGFGQAEFDLAYEPTGDHVEAARRYLVRSMMGFGGNGSKPVRSAWRRPRTGKRGFESYANDFADYVDALPMVIDRLRRVSFVHGDALDLIRQCDGPGVLHFIDPPYLHSRDYSHNMSTKDHERLLDLLLGLKGMVCICGYPSKLYSEALALWGRDVRPASTAVHARRLETLWANPRLVVHAPNLWT